MKKICLLLILLISAAGLQAQESHKDSVRTNYTQEFLVSPLAFFVGGFELGYGVLKNKRNTRLIMGYYFSENAGSYNTNNSKTYRNMEGLRIELQHLYIKPVNGGIRYYAGGYAVFKTIKMDKKELSNTQPTVLRGTALSFGILLGARNYVADNFFFDIFVGGGPTIPIGGADIDEVDIATLNPYKRGITPRAGLTFGLAF